MTTTALSMAVSPNGTINGSPVVIRHPERLLHREPFQPRITFIALQEVDPADRRVDDAAMSFDRVPLEVLMDDGRLIVAEGYVKSVAINAPVGGVLRLEAEVMMLDGATLYESGARDLPLCLASPRAQLLGAS